MRLSVLVILGLVAVTSAQYQFGYPSQYYFSNGYPQPSYDQIQGRSPAQAPSADPRFFFTTLTVTLTTSTSTTLVTSSTTCTTSTSALKIW